MTPWEYEECVYAQTSYDAFLWQLERPHVQDMARRVFRGLPSGEGAYFDFACGTGRILEALRGLAPHPTGVDVSPGMLALARQKLPSANLVCGDLIGDETLAPGPFDLITAFRFFLNHDDLRAPAMRALARRLKPVRGRCIFNVHGNAWSAAGLGWKLGSRAAIAAGTPMSFPQVHALVRGSGMEIESWCGMGLSPGQIYRTPLRPLAELLDTAAVAVKLAHWVSRDLLVVCYRP